MDTPMLRGQGHRHGLEGGHGYTTKLGGEDVGILRASLPRKVHWLDRARSASNSGSPNEAQSEWGCLG
jgi:hypothetical protein